ncbi:MAG TPA: MFS transporter [Gemmatimonadales bacterium]|nr:MFS transporter [Gemmatimonadales bacterium]
MRDRRLLYAAAFLRALATGMAGVLVGIYLAKLGFDPAQAGSVIGAGLGGGALAALVVTLVGDRMGRRPTLVALSLLAAAGGVALAAASGIAVIAAAAFAGMLNGMGRDRGASLIIDQAMLPATAPDTERTATFAWYNVLQDAGHALGGLLAAAPAVLRGAFGLGDVVALRLAFLGYGAVFLATAVVYAGLSREVEAAPAEGPRLRVSPESRRVLWRISSLFAVDSLAGGFLTTALLAFFFYERFGAGEAAVGLLFFGARLANAGSHLGAAWLARRIGLVNTMVFTHIPSSLLLLTVPFAPNYPVAALLFLLREGLVEMDVPTRQSYVMAVVRPEERTFASGVTHLVRLAGWAVAPGFAGLTMRGVSLAMPLVVGAAMKIAYDLLLYAAFRKQRPPEELARTAP